MIAGPGFVTVPMPTAKQIEINRQISKHPEILKWKRAGTSRAESKRRRALITEMAKSAGCSYAYFLNHVDLARCEVIGQQTRAQDEERERLMKKAVSVDVVGFKLDEFKGWMETFTKLRMVTQVFENLAAIRGNVWAKAFLEDVREKLERAQKRALQERDAGREENAWGGAETAPYKFPQLGMASFGIQERAFKLSAHDRELNRIRVRNFRAARPRREPGLPAPEVLRCA